MAKRDGAGAQGKKTLTKKDELMRLLRAKAGADVAALSERLGWQPHTVRAAITGLRKAGHVVVATRPAGGGSSRYRIVSGAGKARVEKHEGTTTEGSGGDRAAGSDEALDAR